MDPGLVTCEESKVPRTKTDRGEKFSKTSDTLCLISDSHVMLQACPD